MEALQWKEVRGLARRPNPNAYCVQILYCSHVQVCKGVFNINEYVLHICPPYGYITDYRNRSATSSFSTTLDRSSNFSQLYECGELFSIYSFHSLLVADASSASSSPPLRKVKVRILFKNFMIYLRLLKQMLMSGAENN